MPSLKIADVQTAINPCRINREEYVKTAVMVIVKKEKVRVRLKGRLRRIDVM